MAFNLRHIPTDTKFCQQLDWPTFQQLFPPALLESVLEKAGCVVQRERKLNFRVMLLWLIALNLFTDCSLEHCLQRLAQGLRFIWPQPDYLLPVASALTYRRYQLGVPPVVSLFKQVCQPCATPQTPGAFRFGLRLMALDSTIEEVPDTPANDRAFGRIKAGRGRAAFCQVRGVYLVECGTHAIVDAGFWPANTSEHKGGLRLLRSLEEGMLIMWDRGFHNYAFFKKASLQKAHILARLPAQAQPTLLQPLADGSYLAWLQPSVTYKSRYPPGERLLVRVIDYTFSDPALPGYGERHRLITTLLDPQAYPALELICLYHEPWEVETAIDELDTHQRLAGRPLRSKKPVGVLQELYGLLLAHYALRYLIHQAALQAGLDPDRLSFTHASMLA